MPPRVLVRPPPGRPKWCCEITSYRFRTRSTSLFCGMKREKKQWISLPELERLAQPKVSKMVRRPKLTGQLRAGKSVLLADALHRSHDVAVAGELIVQCPYA